MPCSQSLWNRATASSPVSSGSSVTVGSGVGVGVSASPPVAPPSSEGAAVGCGPGSPDPGEGSFVGVAVSVDCGEGANSGAHADRANKAVATITPPAMIDEVDHRDPVCIWLAMLSPPRVVEARRDRSHRSHGNRHDRLPNRLLEDFAISPDTPLARSTGARIPWAIESGSRAWGFPSPDSDYDCRFLFIRPRDQYLSLWPARDVMEPPLDKTYDVNGWDLAKAVKLVVKGNGFGTRPRRHACACRSVRHRSAPMIPPPLADRLTNERVSSPPTEGLMHRPPSSFPDRARGTGNTLTLGIRHYRDVDAGRLAPRPQKDSGRS